MLRDILKWGSLLRSWGLSVEVLQQAAKHITQIWAAEELIDQVRAAAALAIYLKPIIPGGTDDALIDALSQLVNEEAVAEFTRQVEAAFAEPKIYGHQVDTGALPALEPAEAFAQACRV